MKRDALCAALIGAGMSASSIGPDTCTVHNLRAADSLSLAPETSSSPSEKISGHAAGTGKISFIGHFDPFNPNHGPAIFTAGIVTDVGTLSATITSQQLNFQTDGPIICQALFQRLAPRAPQYGAQINYAGDRLEVYFDPAYTVTQGSVIFGTNSTSPGASGELGLPRASQDVILEVSPSTAPVPRELTFTIDGAPYSITIPPLATADAKRDTIRSALQAQGKPAFNGTAPSSVRVKGIPTPSSVSVATGMTGEVKDTLSGPGVMRGTSTFQGHFDPLDYNALPAVFTAGIVTDLGPLTVQVSAAELNFQTDGPIICQALFQRLAPRAPQYGAQINYAGDRLEVYFDPAYTVTQGGIIFGTTSPSQGCAGTVNTDACPSPALEVLPSVDGPRLQWFPLELAPAYDVVSGDLGVLAASSGDFAIATQQCLGNDLTGSMLPVPGVQGPGQGTWYVVRSAQCPGNGTYDSWGTHQVAPRDPGIAASGAGCTP